MSLKKKALIGLFWTFAQQFSVQGINLVVSIILARILMPAEFGLIGMLTVFIAIGTSLTDSGMTSSLIRQEDASEEDYSTVFYMNIVFSLLVYLVLFFSAPLIANFFKQPILGPIIRVYTLSFVIRAFVGVQAAKLTKEMKFKVQMLMQLPSVLISGVLGLFLAYRGYGVWSLVWMNLMQSFLFTLQYWIFSGWTPKLVFAKSRLLYHLRFGYKLTISGLVDTLYNNAYNVIIGKFFSLNELGYFSRAQSLQMLPITNITTALDKVTYPMFSSINKDEKKLKEAYKRLMHQVIFWVAPMMVYLIIVAKPLFIILLTEKWLPAVPYFQILCITGILYPFHSYNLNILKVKGRTDLFLKLEIYKKLFITLGITVAIFYGVYGLLIFQVISSIFSFWVNTKFSGRFIDYSGLEQIRDIVPTIIITLFVGGIVWFLQLFVSNYIESNVFLVLLAGTVFVIIYILFCYLYKISALKDFRQLILQR